MTSKVLVISTIDRVDGAAEFRPLLIIDIESILLTDLPLYPGVNTGLTANTQLLQALANLQAQITAISVASQSVKVGIVAVAGGQSSAIPTTAFDNYISTCPSGGGVQALAAIPNTRQIFHNNGANQLTIYPKNGGSDNFSGLAANAGITIDPNGMLTIACGQTAGTFNYY